MPIERPTFHESWYRVVDLHPRLRSTVQITRQHFRGQAWHVVQDHTNNAFFRLTEPAYRFIGLLDGDRSVAVAWKLVNDQLGDDAPTQGEVIQLLGQLYTSNLLQAEVPPDTHTLFNRYKKRRQREISGYLMNILFARIPLIDPDAFLNRWLPLLGWIFSPVGMIAWLGLVGTAVYMIMQRSGWQDEILGGAKNILAPDNLVLLYIGFALIKACHEMGHAISCKKFGRQSGTGGEVHVIGIMLLIFTPVPYVDASSSWALRNKWHRVIVGAAGMWVEFAISAVAAMVWANTASGYWVHTFCYNIMFIASFSTLLFNANPLLRYDGYYMLSDVLEIPNLGQRSKEYIYYLIKRYVWGLKQARNPAYSRSEQGWFVFYAIASFIMRTVVSVSIILYLMSVLQGVLVLLAAVMAISALIGWALVPIGKFIYYLGTNPELSRQRTRAVITTGLFTAALVVGVGLIPVPAHARAQGVVEPQDLQELNPGADGFVTSVDEQLPHDRYNMPVVSAGTAIATARSRELEAQRADFLAEREQIVARKRKAFALEVGGGGRGASDAYDQQIKATDEQIATVDEQIAHLTLRAPIAGSLVAPDLESRHFAYLARGVKVGLVAGLDRPLIRAFVANDDAGPLAREAHRQVEIRVRGRPDILLTGRLGPPYPAGSTKLPSAALGYAVGGDLATSPEDREGTRTTENFFEVRIDQLKLISAPADVASKLDARVPLLPGQTVIIRFDFQSKPIIVQAWTKVLQLFQRKLQNA